MFQALSFRSPFPTHRFTMSSAATASSPHVVEDCRGVLRVLSDGSIIRSPDPILPAAIVRPDAETIEWKDVLFDPVHGLSLRLYKPRDLRPSDPPKLPVLFYFHGGGFCLGSRTWPNFHSCGLRLASALRAVVAAPDYRLAPEHRLPAATDDGAAALLWLRTQASAASPDPWLAKAADFQRVFVSGESAGGNIAHHLALRLGPRELAPVRVRGSVLLMPFFGGSRRTKSEEECPADAFLSRDLSERYWRLALPAGAAADHPAANPFGPGAPSLEAAVLGPLLVVVAEKDLLRDREMEYVERLRELGKRVELLEVSGQQHGFFAMDAWAEPADEVLRAIDSFMRDSSETPSF